jgi:CheY-like chemotaxis protein
VGADQNQYSSTAVTEALASAAKSSGDREAVTRAHLRILSELLQSDAAVFYPLESESSAAATKEPGQGRRDTKTPTALPSTTANFILDSRDGVISSLDPVFAMAHLRNLPIMSAGASLWAAVRSGSKHLGSIALFEQAQREFSKAERQIMRDFASQLANALETLRMAKQAVVSEAPGELDRYISAARMMSGISRDLINPITAMLGYIELLKAEPLEERARHYIAKLQEQTEKAQQIAVWMNKSNPAIVPEAIVSAPVKAAEAISAPVLRMEMQPESASPRPATAHLPPLIGSRFRVLVVQRSEALLEFERAVLCGMQAEVMVTGSGQEAISILEQQEMNAIVVDDDLESDCGVAELFEWILHHKPELASRVLFTLSSRPRPEILKLMESSGAPHIRKPLQIGELYSGVQRILGQSKTESTLLH